MTLALISYDDGNDCVILMILIGIVIITVALIIYDDRDDCVILMILIMTVTNFIILIVMKMEIIKK